MNIRTASLNDVEALVRLRLDLFAELDEMHDEPEEVAAATRRYLSAAIPTGDFTAWIVEEDREVIATSGVVRFERPPAPGNLAGREMYVLNMYTLPAWRGKGIGAALMQTIIDTARSEGSARLWLHASDDGRPIYEKVGFAPNPAYLELKLGPRDE